MFGDAINCNVRVVPLSSSETKARESPDIAEKKITTQSSPPVRYSDIFSVPMEKRMTLIVTRINIASALIAYRVLISEWKSFLNKAQAFIYFVSSVPEVFICNFQAELFLYIKPNRFFH